MNPGGACASSASCCNGMPCVPNPTPGATPPYICGSTSCVPRCGGCTNNADCCPGTSCAMAPGSAMGICGPCGGPPPPADAGPPPEGGLVIDAAPPPDSGPTCALYGQVCSTASDCCAGVPCSGGRCVVF
jgi:hypothetical protein